MTLPPGKLTPRELAAYVFPRCGRRRPDVLVRAAIGLDAAAVDFGAEAAVLSTDPITGAGRDAGWLAVHVGCNDVAAAGGDPVGVLVTLLLAPASAAEDAERLMSEANRAAEELGVEIIGGHSEITADLRRSIVVVSALGRVRRDRIITAAGARPGDTLLLTKSAGLEGTAILAADFAAALAGRLPAEDLARARELVRDISVVLEARAAAGAGASALHDATEGGVLGALAELAEAAGVGVEVDLERIPVRRETRQISDIFGIDPLTLVSSGALVIASADPARTSRAIAAVGRTVAEIGRVVTGPSRVRRGAEWSDLVAPERDALWAARERGLSGRRRGHRASARDA